MTKIAIVEKAPPCQSITVTLFQLRAYEMLVLSQTITMAISQRFMFLILVLSLLILMTSLTIANSVT